MFLILPPCSGLGFPPCPFHINRMEQETLTRPFEAPPPLWLHQMGVLCKWSTAIQTPAAKKGQGKPECPQRPAKASLVLYNLHLQTFTEN